MNPEQFAHDVPPRFEASAGPPPELYDRIAAAVARTPSPRVPLRHRLLWAASALPFAVLIALAGRYAMFGRRPLRIDLGLLPTGHLALVLALLSVLTLGATLLAARPGRHGLGSAARGLFALSVAVTPLYAMATAIHPLRSEDVMVLAATARLHPWGLPCLIIAAIIGALALVALTWALRRSVPAAVRLRGAALGAASGAWAGLALFVHCPAVGLFHLLVAHAAPIAVFTVLGALTIPAFLRT